MARRVHQGTGKLTKIIDSDEEHPYNQERTICKKSIWVFYVCSDILTYRKQERRAIKSLRSKGIESQVTLFCKSCMNRALLRKKKQIRKKNGGSKHVGVAAVTGRR